MKKLVIIDIDGVVADFEGALVSVLEKQFGEVGRSNRSMYSLEDRFESRPDVLRFAQGLANDPNFYYALATNEGAIDFVDGLAEIGHSLMYVSSRPLSAENFTRRWLLNRTIGQVEVYCGISDKAGFLEEIRDSVDFVIEDNPGQINKLKEARFSVLCFDQEWNKDIFPRLYVRSDGEAMLWSREDVEAEPYFEEEKLGETE